MAAIAAWWFTRPEPRLAIVAFGDLPGWQKADLKPAAAALRRSCDVFDRKPAHEPIDDYAGTASDWQKICARLGHDFEGDDPRAFFERNFTPYRLGGEGLFTGYYEPEIHGSRLKHDAFQTPVYGLPSDLIRVDLGAFSPKFKGEHIAGRLDGQRLVPYSDRAEIDRHGVANAKILFWCDDPVALFFLQIQGSGRVRFEDGSITRIQYAGENGRPYTAIGRILVASGRLARDEVSLQSIQDWLKAHPTLAQGVMEADQSFIFFQEAPLGDPSLGSPGAEHVPLTPLGSMAIDLNKNALGVPYYVVTDPVSALLVAQDTGGAIRGQVRGDIFFGFGAEAEAQAGGMKARGRLYVLLPNDVAARLGKGLSS